MPPSARLASQFGETDRCSFGVVGLHTCGDLGALVVKLFAESERAAYLQGWSLIIHDDASAWRSQFMTVKLCTVHWVWYNRQSSGEWFVNRLRESLPQYWVSQNLREAFEPIYQRVLILWLKSKDCSWRKLRNCDPKKTTQSVPCCYMIGGTLFPMSEQVGYVGKNCLRFSESPKFWILLDLIGILLGTRCHSRRGSWRVTRSRPTWRDYSPTTRMSLTNLRSVKHGGCFCWSITSTGSISTKNRL